MSKKGLTDLHFDTLAVRAGQVRTAEQENGEPIFTTSSFIFNSAAEAAARFSGAEAGNVYSRFTNPTVRTFEDRLAALEGGDRCIATSSGMGAILSTCMGLLQAGDHIVSSYSIFGSTVQLFNNYLGKFGVGVDFVAMTDYAAWEAAIRPETKLLFLESPSNPLTEVADIHRLADLAHAHGCLLVVDNCFCTPALQRPLELGADIVVHSATKFLDGQGRCVGGAVVGQHDLLEEKIYPFLRTAGPTMSPFNAWVFLKGLETLSVRMEAHCRRAQELAEWLQIQSRVERVYYPGLPSHPQHELAKQQQYGHGSLLSFEVKGARDSAWKVIDNCALLSITANLGDVKTTITHPSTTTHGRLSQEQRDLAGIKDNLIRISVGLESVADISADLQNGLN